MKTDLNYTVVGNRIKEARMSKNLTQYQLAEIIDTNQKQLSSIECGAHRVYVDTLYAIARALDVSVDYLVSDYDDSKDAGNIRLITDDIRDMTPGQLAMLRDSIVLIKKHR